jgi:hypothetical protein
MAANRIKTKKPRLALTAPGGVFYRIEKEAG